MTLRPPVCAVDPREATFAQIVLRSSARQTEGGGEDPHTRDGGAVTRTSEWQGTKNLAEVGDPNVSGTGEFLFTRVAVETPIGNSVEAGWEKSIDTGYQPLVQAVRTFADNGVQEIQRYPFDLNVGGWYAFRARQCGAQNAYDACTEVYWQGGWIDLDLHNHEMRCWDSTGGNCEGEWLVEAHSPNESWFDLNAPEQGEGINQRDVRVRTAPNTWPLLDNADFPVRLRGASYAAQDAPYYLCAVYAWYNFRVRRGAGC